MAEYNVTWTIQIEADSAREAAKKALEIQRDFFSTATVFEVNRDDNGESETIDLEELTD